MSLLRRFVVVWLSFSLVFFIAALPTETASLTPIAILAPRQTSQAILGWYSTDSTYSPFWCPAGGTYCTSSTYMGCYSGRGTTCFPPITCIGKSHYSRGSITGGCDAGSQCYMQTLHPATTEAGGVVSTFAQCATSSPPILFRASPTPSSTAASTDSTSQSSDSTSQSSNSASHPSPSTRHPPTTTTTSAQSSPTLAGDNRSGLSKGAQAGIGVGAAAGGTTIIVIVVLYWRNKKFRDQVNNIVNNITGNGNNVSQGIKH